MSAFVSHDPEASAEKTLYESICSPKASSCCRRWYILGCDEAVGKIEDGSQREDVPRNVGETSNSRSLKAVFGYGFANLLDSVVWKLERVAVCVNKFGSKRQFVGGKGRQ